MRQWGWPPSREDRGWGWIQSSLHYAASPAACSTVHCSAHHKLKAEAECWRGQEAASAGCMACRTEVNELRSSDIVTIGETGQIKDSVGGYLNRIGKSWNSPCMEPIFSYLSNTDQDRYGAEAEMSAVTYSILLYFQYLALVIFIMKLRFFARDSSDILHKFPWGRPFWARVGFWEMTDKHSRDEFLDVFSDQIREYRNEIRIGMLDVCYTSTRVQSTRSWSKIMMTENT